jgi:uncharacterized protein YggE
MNIAMKPAYRAIGIGIVAAALLIGAFLLGSARASGSGGQTALTGAGDRPSGVVLTASGAGGRITVTGTGTVTGTPNQLVLSMGVQTSASSVSTALSEANQAARRVMSALHSDGVSRPDIQTSGLSIQPNYANGNPAPVGYDVSEQLTAKLSVLAKAGSQIQAAVHAGGNATTVDGVSLNMTDTAPLLARARAAAVRDAQAKASQFASAMHRPLGAVISLTSQNFVPYPIFTNSLAATPAAGHVPISPGKQQVSVQITVVYAIA